MWIAMLALLQSTQPAANCETARVPLPAELSGWSASGDRLETRRAVTLSAGQDAGLIALMPAASRPGGGAAVSFMAEGQSLYAIAVDQAALVDVYRDREMRGATLLASVSHGHGPACSGIRKIVRFRLEGGVHILHLTGMTGRSAKVMLIAPAPSASNR